MEWLCNSQRLYGTSESYSLYMELIRLSSQLDYVGTAPHSPMKLYQFSKTETMGRNLFTKGLNENFQSCCNPFPVGILFSFIPFRSLSDSFYWPTLFCFFFLYWHCWMVWAHFSGILSQGLMSFPFKANFHLPKKCGCLYTTLLSWCQPLNLCQEKKKKSIFYILLACEELGQMHVYKCVIYLLSKFDYFNIGFILG